MSLKETYSLAHTAQCKLRMAAERPDRNLRFLVGHAMHLDSLMLRIVQIEETIDQPQHASEVKFKGAGIDSEHHKSPLSCRSPPPQAEEEDEELDQEPIDDDAEEDDEDDDLGLTRFASGTAEPPRYPENPPQLIPSDEDSESSDEEDYNPDLLKDIISKNNDGDQFLADLYNDVKGCICHKSDAPAVGRMWELPSEKGGVRTAVAEIKA